MERCSPKARRRRSQPMRASKPSIWVRIRSMPELLSLDRLSAGYGEATVLQQVSLALEEGSSLALLGRNGMGKSTLLASVVGVTRWLGGSIRFGGRDITRLPPHQRALGGIGWVPQ